MNAPAQTAIASAVGHAYLPPSGAATWVHCAAAPGMWALYPERDGDPDAAEEGEAAHWVFSELFAGRFPCVGEIAPNGVAITEEMNDGAVLYVETVYGAWRPEAGAIHVEKRIDVPSVHTLNWGTPDTWFYDPVSRTIHLFDYKFGHGYVDEFENWQLIDYAAGIIDLLDLDGTADQQTTVRMTIVQPRCYHKDGPVRTWTVRASDLRPFINLLRSAAERVVGELVPAATVNDGCKHCPGRHACTALQRTAGQAAELSLRSLPDEMTPEARALELHLLRRALARLEARVSGLEDSVHADLLGGQSVPFFGLEQSVGKLAWQVAPNEVEALGRMMSVDLTKPGVLTPTQARDKLKKAGHDPEIIGAYATKPRGAMQLVPVNSKTARKVFQK